MIFWFNLPLAALAIVVRDRALRLLQAERRQHRLDWLGAILIMASTVIFLLILTWGGARFAWVSEPIIGLFTVLLALGAWLGFHLQHASEPLLPMDVLRNPIVLAAAGAVFFAMAAFIGTSVYLPIYFEGMLHLAPSQAGFGLIPLMMGPLFGAAVSCQVPARITPSNLISVAGM